MHLFSYIIQSLNSLHKHICFNNKICSLNKSKLYWIGKILFRLFYLIILQMIESPRKRILTDISSQQPKEKTTITSKISSKKLNRLDRVFKFTPVHTHQIQTHRYAPPENLSSRLNPPVDCLEELNSLFKARKIGEQKYFFSQKHKSQEGACRSKSRINKDIQSSVHYIQNLRKNRNLFSQVFLSKKCQNQENKKSNIMQAIGLSLPELNPKKYYNQRFLTQPSAPKSNFHISLLKEKKKLQQVGLYSYLQRDFIEKNLKDLTQTNVVDYAKNPNNSAFHKIILQKSRSFLKRSAENKYRELDKIGSLVNEQSKRFIHQQLKQTKQKYKRDYSVRNNVPYFSFLSLSQKQKKAVLQSIMQRKKSVS